VVFSDLFRGGTAAAQYTSHLQDQIIALSFQTVGELWYGAIKAGWGEAKRRELDERIRRFVVLACDEATVRAWAELRADADSKV
jgi:predicted nucleic acid-binding protein